MGHSADDIVKRSDTKVTDSMSKSRRRRKGSIGSGSVAHGPRRMDSSGNTGLEDDCSRLRR